jgi:stage III sporulation protein AG
MDSIIKKVSEAAGKKLSGIRNYKTLVVLGFVGMILILVPGLFDGGAEEMTSDTGAYKSSDYAANMERQVEKILSQIQGVGNVNVMLTVEGTEEYIYALESKESISSDSEKSSSQVEQKHIFEHKDGDKNALVKTIINPAVSGVVVVCDGGEDPVVREKVYEAVSVSLGVPANRICVAKSGK